MSEYNLILLHHPDCISDFFTIKNMMAGPAPDIEVHVIQHGASVAPDFWSRIAERPTLLFSPMEYEIPSHVRGTRLVSKGLGKYGEIDALRKAGLPVPRTEKILPETKLDEAEWGPFVIEKPDDRGRGQGIRLERTKDVRWFDPRIYPTSDPRRGSQMLAQQYVFTGIYAQSYRVFTVLGKVIYAIVSTSTKEFSKPDVTNKEAIEIKVAANAHERIIKECYEADILELGERVGVSLPHMPSQGVDIIREHETGRLLVLEINARGGTWHLSSGHGLMHQRTYGLDFYGQFDGLRRIRDSLIEITRRTAS